MGLEFHRQSFRSLSDVLDDVKRHGTWPTTFVSGPSDGLPVHWHAHDVHAYIMEGETDFLDGRSGTRTEVRSGDKIVVRARTLHAEGVVKSRVVYILAVPEPLGPAEFLAMRKPDEL
jgi:mannose-6-phosphate isomerase-like protein (cupin superfamily)